MKYILDTNIIMAMYDENHKYNATVIRKIKENSNHDFFISILTLFEIEYSIENATDENIKSHLRDTLDSVLAFIDYLDLSIYDSQIYAKIKSRIKSKFKISASNMRKLNVDIMIASSAISNDAIFVSNDVNFLKKIKSVTDYRKFESWIYE